MRRFQAQFLVIGALAALALLAGNVVLTYRNTERLYQDATGVAHTHDVLLALENVLSLAKDAETGQRGYLITGDDQYLEPYNVAVSAIHSQVDDFERLTADNPRYKARMPELRARVDAKLDELNRTIVLRRTGGFDAARAVVLAGKGKIEMDALRALVGELMADEQSLRMERAERRDHTFHLAVVEGLFSGVLATLAVGGFILLLQRHIAARARATFIIAEQAERLRTTLASVGDGVIATDTDGRVTMMNGVAESLTGWKLADASGEPLIRVFNIVNETTRHAVESPVARALREGVIVGLANHTVLIAKDGTERAIDDSAAPIRCAQGELVGCVLVFRDITERNQAERKMRDSEARKTAMFETALDCIITIDHEGSIIEFNAAAERTFGHRRQDVLGRELAAIIIPAAFRESHREGLARYLATGKEAVLNRRLELSALRSDGSEFPVELTVTRIPGDGSPVFTAFLRDITERQRAEEALRKAKESAETANVAKDNFLSTLSHELRTPLTPVLATLGAWEHTEAFPPALQDDLQMLRRNVDLEARLIDDLLDLTRIAKGKLALNLEVLNVEKLLDSVISMYRSEINSKKIALVWHPQADQCFVNADPGRLQQAFWNLLKNAVKFTAEGGTIDVSTRNDAHRGIQIVVNDNGVGISPEMIARLFTPFEQENQNNIKRYGGLGLGLAITKTLLEAQGGEITAHSDGKYRGATFVITLPCVEAPIEQPVNPPIDTSNQEQSHQKCLRVLLIEDHIDTANVLSRLMRSSGHEVTVAHSVADAIRALRGGEFDVLVSDVGLPDGTGIDLISRVREQHGLNVPAVAMTGYGMEEDIDRCMKAGFNEHLTKPINFAKLEKVLQRLGSSAAGTDCP